MKFVLNENPKFLLNERFILQEASAAEVAKTWTDQLQASLENAREVLTAYLTHVTDSGKKSTATAEAEKAVRSRKPLADDIKAAAEELENSLSLSADKLAAEGYKAVKAEVNTYSSRLRIAFQETDGKRAIPLTKSQERLLLPQVTAQMKVLATLGTKPTWTAEDITDLKEIIEWGTKNVLPLFDVTEQEGTLSANNTKLETFQKTCQECIELIKDLIVDLPDDFSEFSNEDLRAYRDLVQQALTNPKLKNAEAVKKNTKYKQEILDKLDNYQNQVDALKNNYLKISKSAILTADLNQDWGTKYKSSSNKESVIEEFIYTKWKNDYEEVLKIKDSFLRECESYGFKSEGPGSNPFISYISNVYLKYQVSPAAYTTIHNLTASGYITGTDLAGTGKMERGNLLFCKELYSLDTSVIKLYIVKQFNLLKAALPDESEFASAVELAFNILYDISEKASGDKLKDSTNLKLRTMNAIEQLEIKWLGKASATPLDDEDKPAKKKVASNAELLKQIDTAENAVKVLAALAIKFSSNDKVTAAVQSCQEVKTLMNETTTWDKVQRLVAQVERLYKIENLAASQALDLIKSILESDQFSLTKE